MRILLTGATGFVGRVLVRRLLERGASVTVLARSASKARVFFGENVSICEADICDRDAMAKARLDGKVDAVAHLAASLDYFGRGKEPFNCNVAGTAHVLGLAKRSSAKRFVFASSIEAMGPFRMSNIPADEGSACSPVSAYGRSKMEAEQAVRESAKAGAMDSVILRLGNVYGPGSGFLIPEIANAILKRGALYTFLPFYEDRYIHPLYIDDAVSGTVEALTGEDGSGIFILAGPEYVTIGRLFSLVARVLGMPLGTTQKKSLFDGLRLSIRNAVRHFKRRADMVVYLMAGSRGRIHRAYSIERAKASLGYEPAFDTERGVRETLEWAKREGIVRW